MKSSDAPLSSMGNLKSNIRRLFRIKTNHSQSGSPQNTVASNTQTDWFQQIHGVSDSEVVIQKTPDR